MIELAPEQLELLADLIADRLAARQAGELIDAAELARRLGWSRDRVYANAGQLGAVRLGEGDRPRLAFRWPNVLEGLTSSSGKVRSPASESTMAVGVATGRPRQRLGTSVSLLPVGGLSRRDAA